MSSKIVIAIVVVLVLALLAGSFVVFSQISAEIDDFASAQGGSTNTDTTTDPDTETDGTGSGETSGDAETDGGIINSGSGDATPSDSLLQEISYSNTDNSDYYYFDKDSNILQLNNGTYSGSFYDQESGLAIPVPNLMTISEGNNVSFSQPNVATLDSGTHGTMTLPANCVFAFYYLLPGDTIYHLVTDLVSCPIRILIVDEFGDDYTITNAQIMSGTSMAMDFVVHIMGSTSYDGSLPQSFTLYCFLGGLTFIPGSEPENLFSCKAGTYGGLDVSFAATNLTSTSTMVLESYKHTDVISTYATNILEFHDQGSGWVSDPLGTSVEAAFETRLGFYYREYREDGTLKEGYHFINGNNFIIYLYDVANEQWTPGEDSVYCFAQGLYSKIKIGLADGFELPCERIALYCFDLDLM